MKKRTLKKAMPLGILFFGISLLLWNCEKEAFQPTIVVEETASNYHLRIIALDELYDVKKHLEDLMPQNGSNKTSEIEGAIFDQDHVLEVIDTLQNTNYSLRFTYPDTPSGEFYNLVIGRSPDGVLKTPFVLKYTCDDPFLEEYIAHGFNMYYFKGTIKRYVYTEFFSVDAFSKTTGGCSPELDAVGDPVACEQIAIDVSNASGGSGEEGGGADDSNADGDSGSIGDSSTCTYSIGTNGPCAEGGTAVHSVEACGAGTGVQYVVSIYCPTSGQTRTTDDCPSCADVTTDGGIGVNEPSMESMRVDLIHRLQMNDSNQINWVNDDMNNQNVIDIISFLNLHKDPDGNDTLYAINFVIEAIEPLINSIYLSFNYMLNNKTHLDDIFTNDLNNNTIGGEDTTSYQDFDPLQQTWPTISPVISVNDFVGWDRSLHPTWECMDYSKAQIAKKGYKISNYFNSTGQTIQIYTSQNGVNQIELNRGLSYLKYALEKGIPVIVGVDNHSGSPNPNTDNTTDHFVVIVGMGSDVNGRYFRFYDNASGIASQGANSNNKLYYDSATGMITGTSQTSYAQASGYHNYILTMIRKSK